MHSSINRNLKEGSPVILGSDLHEHWLVLAGFDDNGDYVVMDSADDPLSGTWEWIDIVDWLGPVQGSFDAIAIHPKPADNPRRSMVPHIAGIYERLNNDEDLAGEWSEYLDDLDEVFNFEATRGPRLDAESFFYRNEEPIVQPVLWMDRDNELDEAIVREVFNNFCVVANFHSFELPARFETAAVVHMALILRESVV